MDLTKIFVFFYKCLVILSRLEKLIWTQKTMIYFCGIFGFKETLGYYYIKFAWLEYIWNLCIINQLCYITAWRCDIRGSKEGEGCVSRGIYSSVDSSVRLPNRFAINVKVVGKHSQTTISKNYVFNIHAVTRRTSSIWYRVEYSKMTVNSTSISNVLPFLKPQ